MSKVLIEVTEEDIREGVPCNSSKCPIARAMTRAFKMPVRANKFYYSYPNDGGGVTLPREARQFIHAFDHKGIVQPFSFEVEVDLA